jgi:hypothetical protein
MICFRQRRSRQPKRPGAVGRSIQEKGFCVAISLFREKVLCLRRTFSEDPFAVELGKADICPDSSRRLWLKTGSKTTMLCLFGF